MEHQTEKGLTRVVPELVRLIRQANPVTALRELAGGILVADDDPNPTRFFCDFIRKAGSTIHLVTRDFNPTLLNHPDVVAIMSRKAKDSEHISIDIVSTAHSCANKEEVQSFALERIESLVSLSFQHADKVS